MKMGKRLTAEELAHGRADPRRARGVDLDAQHAALQAGDGHDLAHLVAALEHLGDAELELWTKAKSA
jgi:hypothetical protein